LEEALSQGWVARVLFQIERIGDEYFDGNGRAETFFELEKTLSELNSEEKSQVIKILAGKYIALRNLVKERDDGYEILSGDLRSRLREILEKNNVKYFWLEIKDRVFCGKLRCKKCQNGEGHPGPYIYVHFKDQKGKLHIRYLGKPKNNIVIVSLKRISLLKKKIDTLLHELETFLEDLKNINQGFLAHQIVVPPTSTPSNPTSSSFKVSWSTSPSLGERPETQQQQERVQ